MITSIKNADYSFLFREASEELLRLHDAGELQEQALNPEELAYLRQTDEEGNPYVQPFTSLEQYFTRLGTLVTFSDNPIHYLMLPLDEPCLEVDANTREITLPQNFKKHGVGVQGDVIAETLFLRIDRFFDSMDLLETEGYIQWQLKDGTEGASKIPYIDYKSEHSTGKLILVWPLTEAITAQDGPVQFSLRFLKKNGAKITYSWNSLPCSMTIKKALRVSPDYSEFDDATPLFKMAIENSKHTSQGDEVDPPKFTAPGYDFGLENIAYLTPDNSLTLEAQAWIEDQGALTYNWKYTNLSNSIVEPTIDPSKAKANEFVKTADNAPQENQTYYIKDDSARPYGYAPVSRNDLEADFNKDELYERKAVYRILPDEGPSDEEGFETVVTGTYQLIATHKLGFDSADATLSVTIPGPKVLEFTTGDAVTEESINEDTGEKVETIVDYTGLAENGNFINDSKINLSVAVNTDADIPSTAYQSTSYKWFRKTTADGEMEEIANHVYDNEFANVGKTTDSLELSSTNAVPGWYQVIATSMLNRDEKSIESALARVTNLPVKPSLKFENNTEKDTIDLIGREDAVNGFIELKIEVNEFEGEPDLMSDEFIYEWRLETTPISGLEDTDVRKQAISGLGTDTLKIDCSKVSGGYWNVDCLVSNKLNGQVSNEAARSGIFYIQF